MNAHIPQSYEASTELAEIAAVPHQIISPRNGKPVIGIVQDTLVGSYRITRDVVNLNRREFMNLMMWNKRFEGIVPKARKGSMWSGQQVLSQLLPPINIDMANDSHKDDNSKENYVKIREGDITQGIFDKSIYSKPSKGIIHVTYNDYGSKATVDLIDSLQNTVEQFLIYNGFSVGISDLVADQKTKEKIEQDIQKKKKEIEDIILQVHTDLFDNNTGKSNQIEFENRVIGSLNKATNEAGKTGLDSLAVENRLIAMVKAGSKGSSINIAQMIACVGQQAPEGRRIPYGFSDRTLPHYKKYDDGAEARGFVESSFIRGLTPQEFYFHAMSGREGLIDTAVKSVTADTEIIIIENSEPKHVTIGDWINSQLNSELTKNEVEHHEVANMELLNLTNNVSIPTCDENGNMTWGQVTAITRHDPGDKLYEIKTFSGRDVIVTAGKSLLICNSDTKLIEPMLTTDVKVGDYVPTTMKLSSYGIELKHIDISKYLSKTKYLYGTEFIAAKTMMEQAMKGREKIPAGWWKENNNKNFTLPYSNKAKLQRVIVRSSKTMNNIKEGCIYPFTTNREHSQIPDKLILNEENGIFLGLFLAEGNVDIKSGYVQITNNDPIIRQFVVNWFEKMGINTKEHIRIIEKNIENGITGGTSSDIRGYSTIIAKFLTGLVDHGSANKYVPAEAFIAPEEFITGLLNGYFSGDGSVSINGISCSSVSKKLITGITILCSRIGIFTKLRKLQLKSNNIGTLNILPRYAIDIRSKWAKLFAEKVPMIHMEKQEKLNNIKTSKEHRNFSSQNDIVLDKIIEINEISTDKYPKMYDLTVPKTLNFAIANGLNMRDTADKLCWQQATALMGITTPLKENSVIVINGI